MRHLHPGRLVTGAALLVAAALTATSGLVVGAKPVSGPASSSAPSLTQGPVASASDTSPSTSPSGAAPTSSLNSSTTSSAATDRQTPPPQVRSHPAEFLPSGAASSGSSSSTTTTPTQTPTPTPRPTPAPTATAAPTPAPTATAAPTPAPTQLPRPSGFVSRCGDQLCLDGRVWTFTGVNAYEAATEWGTNAGCGTELSNSQLDQLFSSLGPGHVVRFWAFQALATNYTTKQLDWGPIDRVINAAAAYGDLVIPALANETGSCDDNHWKDAAWYDGGYRNVYDSSQWPASTPLSYWSYVQDFLQRYKDNTTIAMVELVSEPSPTGSGYVCEGETAAAQALRSFFDTVGEMAHAIDPNHLIESGLQGSNQCGTVNTDYGYVMASPGVDVASVHDYETALTPDYFTGAVAEARAVGKPLITGEAGEEAQAALPGCPSLQDRTSLMEQKMNAQLGAGSSGFLAWDWVPSNPGGGNTCSYDIGPADPLIAVLASR